MESKQVRQNRFQALLMVLIICGAALYFLSPFILSRYIEKKILPSLGRQVGASLVGRAYHIGLSGADFGELLLGGENQAAVRVASIHTDYSPFALAAGKIDQVRVNGLILHLELKDGRIYFRGLPPVQHLSPKAPSEKQAAGDFSLSLVPGKLQISNGRLTISSNGKTLLLPFSLQLSRQEGTGGKLVFRFNLQVMEPGEELFLSGILDLNGSRSSLTLSGAAFDANRVFYLLGLEDARLHLGKVAIHGEAEFTLPPFRFVAASLSLGNFSLSLGKVPVRFGGTSTAGGAAIGMQLERVGEQLLLSGRGALQEPLQGDIEVKASFAGKRGGVSGSGNLLFRGASSGARDKAGTFFILPGSGGAIGADFSFATEETGQWQAELVSMAQPSQQGQPHMLQAAFDGLSVQARAPFFTVMGQGGPASREIETSLTFPGVTATYEGAGISTGKADLQATYRQEKTAAGRMSSDTTLTIGFGGTEFHRKDLNGGADIELMAKVAYPPPDGNIPLQAGGRIVLSNGTVADRASGVRLNSMAGEIPFSWPPVVTGLAGHLEIPGIWWQNTELGSVRTDITLQDSHYTLAGTFSSRLLPGVAAPVSGRLLLNTDDFHGEFALQSAAAPFGPIDLGMIDPALENSFLSGEIDFDTFLSFKRQGMSGTLSAVLQNGTYEFPEKNYSVNNIAMRLHMPSLPDVRTAPAQTLSFGEAALGNLAFNRGNILWQLESPTSFFVEEAVLQWAGGRVFTNSVRVSSEAAAILLPIFCDRLRLAEILRQLGFAGAEGEGTVNGRIPLRVAADSLSFEDGFLYSSPGQGGSIKVAALDLLSANIPRNTPQFTEVDFAAEALKNFQYNWVKLLFNSEGEDLLLHMQMDGRPVRSLPFTYDSRTGQLQRTADGSRRIDQPIRLDVNFRFPLDRFLDYSTSLQDKLKNFD